MVPIPNDALDGLAAFEREGGLTRKDLLERGAGMVLLASAAGALSPRGILESAAAQAADNPNGTILVSLYLDGGNDFLNTFAPITDPRYRELRPRVALAADQVLPVQGSSDFGWHPSMAGIANLYNQGKVAVLPAVDYLPPDLSHFNSQGFWQRGVVGPTLDRTGWLGRTIDRIGNDSNPLQAISVSWGLDPTLISRKNPVGTVFDPGSFGFHIPDVWSEDGFTKAYRDAARGAKGRGIGAAAKAYNNAFRMVDLLKPLRDQGQNPPPTPVAYPNSNLGRAMRNGARMLGAGFGTRVMSFARGGFDTHDAQLDEHTELLKDVSDSIVAFQADIDARGLGDRVVILVWSEFGRRPQDNNGNGTDHGAGGGVMVIGNRVRGGIASEFPGLSSLDPDDNLKVTTEFRTVYASLLEGWLGVDAGSVLPKMDNSRIPLIR
jgi:uncharacterized protein (DUF1501 family)